MRAAELLRERDRPVVQKHHDNLKRAVRRDPSFPAAMPVGDRLAALLTAFESIVPAERKEFVGWLVTHYIAGEFVYRDRQRLKELLVRFQDELPSLQIDRWW